MARGMVGGKSPSQLDATARAGVSFDNVIASGSWTFPNHASLFTGEYPWVHGGNLAEKAADEGSISNESSVTELHGDIPTLAEKFSATGYRTAAFSANTYCRARQAFREEVSTGTQSIPPELQSQLEQLGYLVD